MDDRELWNLEDLMLRADENGENIDKYLIDIWERECAREELLKAKENLKMTLLEAARIPSIVSWLADKIKKITRK